MGDFAGDIDSSHYLYSGTVYYTEPTGEYRETATLKMRLTSENFNFNLAKSDGSDFRLCETAGGNRVLNMWIANWSQSNQEAVLFFKGIDIDGGSSREYTAFWGNEDAANISDGDSIDVYFYEDFSSGSLSSSKWTGDLNNGSNSYGYNAGRNTQMQTTTDPLNGVRSWIIECGMYTNWSHTGNWDSNDMAIWFQPHGYENGFYIGYMHDNRAETNVVTGSSFYSTGTYRGLEGYSYNQAYLVYYEPEDKARFKLIDRNTFDDSSIAYNRKVEGDTRIGNVSIRGAQTGSGADGAYYTYLQWFIIRDFDTYDHTHVLDASELYREYAHVKHQTLDNKSYGADLTSSTYYHESDFGGVPRNLSIDLADSEGVCWISDENATDEDYVMVGIGFYGAWDLTSRRYYHYDTGSVDFYNASKLSNNGQDTWDRHWFESTTTSGWVSIKYEGRKRAVGHLSIKAMDVGRPKNYTFYADTVRPTTIYSLGKELLSGTFTDTDEWQHIIVPNSSDERYYTLDIKDTYDDENIKVEEWQMHSASEDHTRKYLSQLRLHPCTYDEDANLQFPKEIKLQGSDDMLTWTTLIDWTPTYSPYVVHQSTYGYWQRYSFDNIFGFFNFRLLCRGNWGGSGGRIAIGQWGMHELTSEDYTYRILQGDTNNVSQIWANEEATFDDSEVYLAIEELSIVSDDALSRTEELPEDYTDINVV